MRMLWGPEVFLMLLARVLVVAWPPLQSMSMVMLPRGLLVHRGPSHVRHGGPRLVGGGPRHVWCGRALLAHADYDSPLVLSRVLMQHLLRGLVTRQGPGTGGQGRVRPPYTLPWRESHRVVHLASHLLSRSSQP